MKETKKKVIMIGGTSYSGSTLLELMIANDPQGFSCGEVWSLFMPHKIQHYDPTFPMDEEDPEFWTQIRRKGWRNVYDSIFQERPEITFITDNTKRPVWQCLQKKILQARGYQVYNLIIWKTPDELAGSFHKRNRGSIWTKKWLTYHRQYFSFIKEFRSVKYSDLAKDPSTLESICNYLGIDYFPEKREYWNKNYYTLFGNKRAKVHLFDQSSEQFQRVEAKIAEGSGDSVQENHRSVSYAKTDSEAFKEEVVSVVDSPDYPRIVEFLKAHDISKPKVETVNYQGLSSFNMAYRVMIFRVFQVVTFGFYYFHKLTGMKLGKKIRTSE